jgi:signal recognition particle receptor subunit alpha
MAELDMSKVDTGTAEDAQERALEEARQAFLPTKAEEETVANDQQSQPPQITWSAQFTGLLQQMTGRKVLSEADLEQPLAAMQELLTSKNVATNIAKELCDNVRASLQGKKLNSMYRVQTAVQQSLETSISKLLLVRNNVDLLRNVLSKRGDGSLFRSNNQKPYVISVMGINGIGKTTTLAKLAYYFKTNGCNPLLVAGDTFRSGAVEQLQVHADCLRVDMYSQGYSKDPSAVAKAAIEQAVANANDVVLIDTAGRMQNNIPLMKSLGKLVQENRPDFIILACEALVGHDGTSQYEMFSRAVGARRIDGLILTKYDTVSDKVGAALTLTHETGTPILFAGTGQKYHHLKRLSVPSVVNSLFS